MPKDHKGASLVELVVALGLASVFFLSLGSFVRTMIGVRTRETATEYVNGEGTLALETLLQNIRNAASITGPTPGQSASTLTLVMRTGVPGPVIYTLASGAITMKQGTGVALPLTDGKIVVTNLSFTNTSLPKTPGAIRVSFTASRLDRGGSPITSFTKTFVSSASIR